MTDSEKDFGKLRQGSGRTFLTNVQQFSEFVIDSFDVTSCYQYASCIYTLCEIGNKFFNIFNRSVIVFNATYMILQVTANQCNSNT